MKIFTIKIENSENITMVQFTIYKSHSHFSQSRPIAIKPKYKKHIFNLHVFSNN